MTVFDLLTFNQSWGRWGAGVVGLLPTGGEKRGAEKWGLGDGWSTGFSDMTLTYDWENTRWSSLPLGAKLSKLFRIGKLPLQVSTEYEYNFADDTVGPKQVFRVTAKFLFPGPG